MPSDGECGGRSITRFSAGSTPIDNPSRPSVIKLSQSSCSGSRAMAVPASDPDTRNGIGQPSITMILPRLPAVQVSAIAAGVKWTAPGRG
jgi:hypothetical protein